MFNNFSLFINILIVNIILIAACSPVEKIESYKPNVLTTNEIISEAVEKIGGDFINISTITNKGSDVRTRVIGEYDLINIDKSDLILYIGLYHEGRLQNILNKIKNTNHKVEMISSKIQSKDLLKDESRVSEYNPFFWLNVKLWIQAVYHITDILIAETPINKELYTKNEELYVMRLFELDKYIKNQVEKIPENKRFIITPRNSFDYFGKAYGFKTKSLHNLDTINEISIKDIMDLSNYIIENDINVIFTEISVPNRLMNTLVEVLDNYGHKVKIGGTLYSDTLGEATSKKIEYIKMMKYNIDTIVNALS